MDRFARDIKKVNLKAVGALMSYMNLKTAEIKHDFELTCKCLPCSEVRMKLGLQQIGIQGTFTDQEGN